ncbi:unnamed protein product [Dicrocoelium dendriticum]|nr:unnamed protein product [Dicrocoelium dendriticum]
MRTSRIGIWHYTELPGDLISPSSSSCIPRQISHPLSQLLRMLHLTRPREQNRDVQMHRELYLRCSLQSPYISLFRDFQGTPKCLSLDQNGQRTMVFIDRLIVVIFEDPSPASPGTTAQVHTPA